MQNTIPRINYFLEAQIKRKIYQSTFQRTNLNHSESNSHEIWSKWRVDSPFVHENIYKNLLDIAFRRSGESTRFVSTRLERKMSRFFTNVTRETAAINQRGIPLLSILVSKGKGVAFQTPGRCLATKNPFVIPLRIHPPSPPFFSSWTGSASSKPLADFFFPPPFLFFPQLPPPVSGASSESILDFRSWENSGNQSSCFKRCVGKFSVEEVVHRGLTYPSFHQTDEWLLLWHF